MTERLAAGRELDAAIEERIYNRVPCKAWNPGPGACDHNPPLGCYPQNAPRPFSSTIVYAWKVVDKMAELGWHCQIVTPFRPGDFYFVGFTPHDRSGWNGKPDHEAYGSTAYEATCRAALAAVDAGGTGE